MQERKSNQRSDAERRVNGEREMENKTSRSLVERQREVIQIERRCLIWHSVTAETLNRLQFLWKVKAG